MTTETLLYAAAVLVGSFAIRGASGFGSGLVATPLLALIWPLQTIVPPLALVTAFSSLGLSVIERSRIRWNELGMMSVGIVIGVGAGTVVLTGQSPTILQRALGVLIIGYALYRLSGQQFGARSSLLTLAMGIAGGALDFVFGVGGPIFVMALAMRISDKDDFRATISAVLLLDLVVRLIAYQISGLLDFQTWVLGISALPFMALGMFIGHRISARIDQKTFEYGVIAILIASGLALVVK